MTDHDHEHDHDFDGPEITFDESATETIIEAFDWHVDEAGYVVDEDGEYVPDTKGRDIIVDEVAGIVDDEDGNTALLRDNFVDICDYVKRTMEQDEPDDS